MSERYRIAIACVEIRSSCVKSSVTACYELSVMKGCSSSPTAEKQQRESEDSRVELLEMEMPSFSAPPHSAPFHSLLHVTAFACHASRDKQEEHVLPSIWIERESSTAVIDVRRLPLTPLLLLCHVN